MNLDEYRQQVGRIPYGKRLPTALYVHRVGLAELGGSLGAVLDQVVARQTHYEDNINPPILHREETFLLAGHALRARFEALTRAEEAAGLYEETATIGFKLNWEKLPASKGLNENLNKRRAGPRSAL